MQEVLRKIREENLSKSFRLSGFNEEFVSLNLTIVSGVSAGSQGSLRKTGRRSNENVSKVSMSRTTAMHVRFKSWLISLPSSANKNVK